MVLPPQIHNIPFTTEGVFNVVLTVFDSEGLSDIDSLVVTVDDPATNNAPVAIASASPLNGEAPLDVSFTGSGSTDDVSVASYSWDFGDGNSSTEADPNHTYASSGTFDAVLTVLDGEGLSSVDSLIIDVSPDLPPTLTLSPDPFDFGVMPINGNVNILDLDVFNEGSGNETINITAINITGTHAVMFGHSAGLPLAIDAQTSQLISVSFTPDDIDGTKSATLEVVHDGGNSPLTIPLSAVLIDPSSQVAVARINVAGLSLLTANDGGLDWESNPTNGAYTGTTYAVNTGNNLVSNLQFANRDSSIPAYIDAATFAGLFGRERYDLNTGPEMEFTIPLANGIYTVNIYTGDGFAETNQPGLRSFDILLEGNVVEDDLDITATFGHEVAVMLSYLVQVTDGVLNISFGHEVQNPLLHAIEVIDGAVIPNQAPVAIAAADALTGEVPLDVNFTGSSSTDDIAVVTYNWDFGDGNVSTEADPLHTYTAEGTYDAVLTVFDGENLSDVDSLIISVTPDLPPELVVTPDPLDFGSLQVNSSSANLDLNAFNQDGTGQFINISAINISGVDAGLFSQNTSLPLAIEGQSSQNITITFTPDAVEGSKSASVEIIHDGDNSPVTIILSATLTGYPPLVLDPITDQFNQVGENSSLAVSASGGDPVENITYSISGQPSGLDIEPTNGQIIGTVDPTALTGGPGGDGVHTVTVTASKPGSTDDSIVFSWTITANSTLVWTDKNEDENYTARHECSFVQAGDKFFLFGGRENAQTLDIYDYTTNSWNALVNSAPVEFNHFQATEYQGLIWIIGAFNTNTFPTETPAEYIWAFNPATAEWIQGPQIPVNRRRGSAGLVVYNDKFYIVAGNTIGHNGGYVPWFDEYDPATGTWTVLADAPRARDHFHAAVINGKLYAASGRLSGGPGGVFAPVISEVDVYDFATSTWSTLPSAQDIPTPRAAATVANLDNKLVVAGGESLASLSAFTITEIYDPATQSWESGADLNHARHGTQAIVSGPGIFVAGGSPLRGGGNQLNMEVYGSDLPEGTPSVASNLSGPVNVDFAIGETKDIILDVTGGNVGIIVESMQITGPDALEFSIDSGELFSGLIGNNAQHIVGLSHNGTEDNKSATLVINYNNTDSISIDLSIGLGANQAPVAVASASPFNGMAPLDVSFVGSNSTDDSAIVSYLWDFGDGNTSTLADPNHTFNSEGTFTVELTVTDDQGFTDVAELTITVYSSTPVQRAVAVASATPLTGEIPLDVSFTGSSSYATTCLADYEENSGLVVIEAENIPLVSGWNVENSSTGFTGNGYINWTGGESFSTPGIGIISTTIKINTPGTYLFEWRSKIGSGSSISSNNDAWVRFNDASEFYAVQSGNIIYPQGSGQTPTVNGSGGDNWFKAYTNAIPWNWQTSTNDGSPYLIYVDFDAPGIYTMEISGRSENFFIDRIVLSASGNEDLGLTETLCAVNDPTAIVSYSWDFGDGNTSTEADPSHTYVTEGAFNVSLTVIDDEGNSDVASLTVNVTPDLPPSLALTPDPLDFGSLEINGSVANLNLDAFNQGSIGESINITSINITGANGGHV